MNPTQRRRWGLALVAACVVALMARAGDSPVPPPLHTYVLPAAGTPAAYDEAVTVSALQGLINRTAPELYLFAPSDPRPAFWLNVFHQTGRWLEGRSLQPVAGLDALVRLAADRLKGAVIWDPAVPATVNVATTAAGVLDLMVVSPDQSAHLAAWGVPVVLDLRGKFTGAETGSAKNDAYRWALREFLATGRCSTRWMFLYHDAFFARAQGHLAYAVNRDWAVRNRAFVFDLSPWADEKPEDDPDQRLGLDQETYRLILEENLRQTRGEHMTELAGFFDFQKYSNVAPHRSRHEPVPTEWQTVWMISPYNAYQNTVTSDCYNQSFHSHAPRAPLRQHPATPAVPPLENKVYVSILMADYDSGTPLYDFLPKNWLNHGRGELPLAWGVNPNLRDTYPDIVEYFYAAATPIDLFVSDASAAGYMNPNRIKPEYLPLFVRHNQRYFREQDQSIAAMVLDWDQPTPAVKDAFREFAPDGFATIVMDLHDSGGKLPDPQVWKGMPVLELVNNAGAPDPPALIASHMAEALRQRGPQKPGFYFFRLVWISPRDAVAALDELRKQAPDIDFTVVDLPTLLALFKQAHTP
ncbi:MAG: hypothetical protein H7A44_02515 [Opitutaceae bacterium]|nr:hypothetical protein [Cephaloticoccus sp.]MCP5529290.1 hypothetical protein [Opitutaceae bacterium]